MIQKFIPIGVVVLVILTVGWFYPESVWGAAWFALVYFNKH